jgi:hypothetical protein
MGAQMLNRSEPANQSKNRLRAVRYPANRMNLASNLRYPDGDRLGMDIEAQ